MSDASASAETSIVSTGAKRPATSDLTEPADKKAKTVAKQPPQQEPDKIVRSSPGGILTTIANRFSAPFAVHDTEYIVVLTEHMVPYFRTIRNALIEAVYPDLRFSQNNTISEDHFALVCRYLTKARCDHIYATYSGRRPPHRIAISRDLEVPKCLADVVNGIGTFLTQSGLVLACPQPEPIPDDPAQRLENLVTHAMLNQFSRLVSAAKVRNLIRTSLITATVDGTAWWLLSARSPINANDIAIDRDSVTVYSIFKEWTPADGVLAAIVQRQYNGLFAGDTHLKASFDTLIGVWGLQRSFNLDA